MTDLASEKDQQVVGVSHHPEAINYLAADSICRMWRDPSEGFSRIAPLDIDREAGVTAYDVAKMSEDDASPNPV